MSLSAISPLIPTNLQRQEFAKEKPKGWGDWFKNALFGRVCANWETSALAALSMIHLIAAVIAFIEGSWIFATIFLASALSGAAMHTKMRNFTSWHKALDRTENENIKLYDNNNRLSKSVGSLEKVVEVLKGEREKIAEEAEKLNKGNAQYQVCLGVMDTQINRMQEVLTGKEELTGDMLKKFQDCIQTYNAQKEAIDRMTGNLDESQMRVMKQFETVAKQIEKGNLSQLALIKHMEEQLKQTETSLAKTEALLGERSKELGKITADLEKAKEALREEIAALKETVRLNKEAAEFLRKTAKEGAGGSKEQAPSKDFPWRILGL